jgi:hypothetical protein
MGNPAFYYYPNPGGRLVVVDWGRPISDVFMVPGRVRVDALGGDMVPHHRLGPGSARVNIRRERFTNAALERQLRTMEDHLMRGGRVGFSWDHAKTWAAYGTGGLTQGDTLCYTFGTSFARWSASGALSSGDEIVIESCNPEMKREVNTVSSITGGQISLGAVATYTFEMRHFVRYRWFYPALYLPQDQLGRSLITGDRNVNWTFAAELAIDPRILAVGLDGYEHEVATPTLPDSMGADLGLGGTGESFAQSSALTLDDLLATAGGRVGATRARAGAMRK